MCIYIKTTHTQKTFKRRIYGTWLEFRGSRRGARRRRLNTWRPHQADRSCLGFQTSPFSFALLTPHPPPATLTLFHQTYLKRLYITNTDPPPPPSRVHLENINKRVKRLRHSLRMSASLKQQRHQQDSIVLFLANASNSTWWPHDGGQIKHKLTKPDLSDVHTRVKFFQMRFIFTFKTSRARVELESMKGLDRWKRSVGKRGRRRVLILCRDVISTDT